MPVGIGLHILLALICAVHAVRTRQPLYWVFILFAFPLLGSVVYFLAVYLPSTRLERNARLAIASAAKAIDPTRDVREARVAYEDAPTAQNRMRLAAALLDSGEAEEAAQQYEACLSGPFANDPEIRFGAARAFTESLRYADALVHLHAIREQAAGFRPEAVSLLVARCLAGTSRRNEARAEYEQAVARFATYEAKAEYAIFALAVGDHATARSLDTELERLSSRWNAFSRQLNEPVFRRYRAAKELSGQRA
jgi:hypothetical protein